MLNKNQICAVEHIYGPCLTLAGPGSGKTTVIVERIKNLIKVGINPNKILVITFTKAAALEMKTRFLSNSPENYPVTFGTFHSVFYGMLKSHSQYKGFKLLEGPLKSQLLNECLRIKNIKSTSFNQSEDIQGLISFYYNSGKIPKEGCSLLGLNKTKFLDLVSLFDERKKEGGFIDFDDMLIKTKQLLKKEKDFLTFQQSRFSFYLIDEFQDINKSQYDILKLLIRGQKSPNLFCVGDDDQAIYSFRGACPDFLLNFPDEFKGCKVINLNTNYRSDNNIVEKSTKLISYNKNRFFKDLYAFSKRDGKAELLSFDKKSLQSEHIANILREEKIKGNLRETAILYRNKKLALPLIFLLKKYGISPACNDALYDYKYQSIIKDIRSYFKLIDDSSTYEDLLNILNKPDRLMGRGGIGDRNFSLIGWRDYYPRGSYGYNKANEFINQISFLKTLSVFSAFVYIRKGLEYEKYLINKYGYSKEQKEEVLNNLDTLELVAKNSEDIKSFLEFLNTHKEKNPPKEDNDKVYFYTFHSSKGLEFERVFIIDAMEGITPPINSGESILEEERRIFYVAMTRAKSELYICHCAGEDTKKYCPSRFINEIFDLEESQI